MMKHRREMSKTNVAGVCSVVSALLLSACGERDGSSGSTEDALESVALPSQSVLADYVHTPGGLTHKSCVHEIPNDGVFDKNNDISIAGRTVAHVDPCRYPRYRGHAQSGSVIPTVDGWIESAGAYAFTNQWGFSWFNEIQATMRVPKNPVSSPTTDFLWFGLENAAGTAVLQPVMQYGTSDAGDVNGWGVAVWYVASDGNVSHSGLVKVSTGDLITAMVRQSCATSGAPCKVLFSVQQNGNQIMTVSMNSIDEMQIALKGVLEADGVSACNQLPASGATPFFDVHVYMPGPTSSNLNDVTSSLLWGASVFPVSPQCSYSVTMQGPGSAILFY